MAEWNNSFSSSTGQSGIYENGNYTLIWLAPEWNGGSPQAEGNGLTAYSDGNGSFYIDSCLVFYDVGGFDDAGDLVVEAQVLNWIAYTIKNSTLVNNGGYEYRQLGGIDYYTSYVDYAYGQSNAFISNIGGTGGLEPQPSSISSYTISFGVTESISLTYGPYITAELGDNTYTANNYTWVFTINNGSQPSQQYSNTFIDPFYDAYLVLPDFTPSNTYTAILPVYFENLVVTGINYVSDVYSTVEVCNYEQMWSNVLWYVSINPIQQVGNGQYLVSLTNSYSGIEYANAPPGSYLTGLVEGTYVPCGNLSPP